MNRILTYLSALLLSCASAHATSHSLYVKYKDGVVKYSFGVAGNLKFNADGTSLYVNGYDSSIKLADIEYMSFEIPTDGQMSSTEHKDRLLHIGEELNSKIDANDAADIIGFVAEYDNLGYMNDDALAEAFKQNHPDLVDDDDDYRYHAPLHELAMAMADIAKGNYASSRKIGKAYTELFTRDDLKGVFKADTENRKWVKVADADYFEIQFTGRAMGKNYTLRAETAKEYTVWTESIDIKESDGSTTTYNVTGHVPTTVTCTVKMQNSTIFSGKVNFELNQEAKAIDMTTTVNCANVSVDDRLSVRNTSAEDYLTVKIKDELILTNKVNFTGSRLLNVPEWAEDLQGILDEYEAEHYNEYYYDPDGRKIVRRLGKLTSHTDILGKLQVVGHAVNYDKSYDELEEYIEENDDEYSKVVNHDKHTVTYTYGSESAVQKIADVVNNYTDASFYYDNDNKLQGFIDWRPYESFYDDWTTSGYWDDEKDQWIEFPMEYTEIEIEHSILPYITFADGSSFAFDSKYFTGSNFQKLINDAEDIADIIDNILNDYDYNDYDDEYDYDH